MCLFFECAREERCLITGLFFITADSVLDRPGLKGIAEIGRLNQAVLRALKLELDRNHTMPIKGDVTVCDALLTKIPNLR